MSAHASITTSSLTHSRPLWHRPAPSSVSTSQRPATSFPISHGPQPPEAGQHTSDASDDGHHREQQGERGVIEAEPILERRNAGDERCEADSLTRVRNGAGQTRTSIRSRRRLSNGGFHTPTLPREPQSTRTIRDVALGRYQVLSEANASVAARARMRSTYFCVSGKGGMPPYLRTLLGPAL